MQNPPKLALLFVPNHPAFYPHIVRHAQALRTKYARVVVGAVFRPGDALPSLDGVEWVSCADCLPAGVMGFLRLMKNVWRVSRDFKCVAIEAVDPPCLIPAALASLFRPTRLVYFSMEIFAETPALANKFWKRLVWKRLEILAVRRAQSVLTVNRSVATRLQKLLGIPSVKVVRSVPYQSPFATSSGALRAKCGIGATEFLLLYQGHLEKGRGIEFVANCLRKRPAVHFAVMGFGPLGATIEGIAQSQANLHFCGAHPFETLMSLAQDASAGVVWIEPIAESYRLSLPGKIFEYVQSGLPVLGSPLPEIAGHIQTHGIGEVGEEFSEAAFLRALDSLCENVRQGTYANSLAQARLELCWEREQAQLLEAF
jgi:glycosyltransferase involved in cell wall biosynthesis